MDDYQVLYMIAKHQLAEGRRQARRDALARGDGHCRRAAAANRWPKSGRDLEPQGNDWLRVGDCS